MALNIYKFFSPFKRVYTTVNMIIIFHTLLFFRILYKICMTKKIKIISTKALFSLVWSLYVLTCTISIYCDTCNVSNELQYTMNSFYATTYIRPHFYRTVTSFLNKCSQDRGDKPETIKSTATLDRGRVFTDTFIHFLRFTSDKTAEPITLRNAAKNPNPRLNLNCRE